MRIIFAGTPDFAVPSLKVLLDSNYEVCAVYTQPDRPAGRGRHNHLSPVKELALKHSLPVIQPLTLKSDDELQQLISFNADLIVVVAYGIILTQAVLYGWDRHSLEFRQLLSSWSVFIHFMNFFQFLLNPLSF
jgi:methionyl-tRNA formyltransferase